MASYVDVSDKEGALAAARKIAELADALTAGGLPPEAQWGTDELGTSMKSRYLTAPTGRAHDQRTELAAELRRIAASVHAALAELEEQEHMNMRLIREIRPLSG